MGVCLPSHDLETHSQTWSKRLIQLLCALRYHLFLRSYVGGRGNEHTKNFCFAVQAFLPLITYVVWVRLPPQQPLRPLHHVLRQEPERLLQILVLGRGSEALDAVDLAVQADVLGPAEGGGGFDGETLADLRRQDRVAVLLRLGV